MGTPRHPTCFLCLPLGPLPPPPLCDLTASPAGRPCPPAGQRGPVRLPEGPGGGGAAGAGSVAPPPPLPAGLPGPVAGAPRTTSRGGGGWGRQGRGAPALIRANRALQKGVGQCFPPAPRELQSGPRCPGRRVRLRGLAARARRLVAMTRAFRAALRQALLLLVAAAALSAGTTSDPFSAPVRVGVGGGLRVGKGWGKKVLRAN